MLLALDVCGVSPSLALVDNDGLLVVAQSLPPGRHNGDALTGLLVDLAKTKAFGCIEQLAVSTGPASYTGIRVCLSLVKGLALARSLPVFGASAFEIISDDIQATDLDLVLIDAGRGRIWGQMACAPQSPVCPLDHWLSIHDGGHEISRILGHPDVLDAWLKVGPIKKKSALIDAQAVARFARAQKRRGFQPSRASDILPLYLRSAEAQLSAGKSLVSTLLENQSVDGEA